MSISSWRENQIIQAYEANFNLLESARKEYAAATNILIDGLHSELAAIHLPSSLNPRIVTSRSIQDGDAFAQRHTSFQLLSDGEPLMDFVLRIATPWGGPAGTVQIVVLPDPVYHEVDRFRRYGVAIENVNQCTFRHEGSLYNIDLDICTDIATTARKSIEQMLIRFAPLANDILEVRTLRNSVSSALAGLAEQLQGWPSASAWSLDKATGFWEGIRFVQIRHSSGSLFWAGYHQAAECLMYGHSKSSETFARDFATRTRASQPLEYKGYPSGVVACGTDLQRMSATQIQAALFALFEAFRDTFNSSPLSAAVT